MNQNQLLQQQSAMQALMELMSEKGNYQQTLRFGLTLIAESLDMTLGMVCLFQNGQYHKHSLVSLAADVALHTPWQPDTNREDLANCPFASLEQEKTFLQVSELESKHPDYQDYRSLLAAPFNLTSKEKGGVVFLGTAPQQFTSEQRDFIKFAANWVQQKMLQNRLLSALQIAEDEIAQLAFYDSLTDLPNKRLLIDRLAQSLLQSQRDRSYGALIFIDLDDFKTLNETLGHESGDELLQFVATRLKACLREADTVARLGGDEFVVMLDQLETKSEHATQQIEAVGDKVIAALNQPYLLNGLEYFNTPTLGATLFNGITDTVAEVLKRADVAMYQAKHAGKNCLRFFDQNVQANILQKNKLEEDLRLAISLQQFELYYQPQLDRIGHVTGAEALIRWQHPKRGFVSPMEFIPLAEETGLITEIGQWVLEAACQQLAKWSQHADTVSLNLAVNVSARQFQQANFVSQVLQACEQAGTDPKRLKLELTESMLAKDIDEVITKMSQLRDKGVTFSLDDFGTGFSSLSFLKLLPLNQLKIDKSFVRDVLTDNNDAVIARTIVALAKSLGLNVIAEGVEYEGQKEFLAKYGCYEYQGYLFSQPLSIQDFNAFCDAHFVSSQSL